MQAEAPRAVDTTTPSRAGRAAPGLWLALGGVVAGLWLVAWWVQKAPAPRGLDAPAEEFSQARAMIVVRKLADEIGPHPIGSAAFATAAEFLAAELRKLPRVEVELQDAEGDNRLAVWTGVNFHYRVRNVVARLPGRRSEALLINAHCDSPAEAPGASDNGIGTAAAIETMRALAAAPQLEWTVVLNLNGGEEAGSVGAAGFLQHRWARDVRAFLDTDGSGAGKAALIQASARVPALIRAYARTARSPQASVFHNDVAQSGLLGQSGDFEPLERWGIPGLDFAALGDIWAVHTHLDVSSRLSPGTLQHLGDTFLGTARELARGTQLDVMPDRTVYYDLMGQTLLVYSMRTARVLALMALLLLGLATWRVLRSGEITGRQLARGFGWTFLSALAGLVGALLVGIILGGLQRAHGWFALPLLAVPTFVGAGLCGALAVHALWRRRALASGMREEAVASATWLGGVLGLGIVLVLCSAGALGIGYLALWWVAPSALAVLAGVYFPRAWAPLWLISVALGMAGFVQLAVHMLAPLTALSGMFPGPPPGEVKLAVVLWLLVVLPLALGGLAGVHRVGHLRQAFWVCAALTGCGVLGSVLHAPYSAARPKRVLVTHAQHGNQSALLLMSFDALPLTPALTALPEVSPLPAGEYWPNALLPPDWLPAYSHKLPAPPLDVPPPRLEVLSRREEAGLRVVTVRLFASGWMTSIDLPRAALAGWSLGDSVPEPSPGMTWVTAAFYAPNPAGQDFTLRLRGAAPVELIVRQNHAPAPTAAVLELRRRLPDWTTINATALHIVKQQL